MSKRMLIILNELSCALHQTIGASYPQPYSIAVILGNIISVLHILLIGVIFIMMLTGWLMHLRNLCRNFLQLRHFWKNFLELSNL